MGQNGPKMGSKPILLAWKLSLSYLPTNSSGASQNGGLKTGRALGRSSGMSSSDSGEASRSSTSRTRLSTARRRSQLHECKPGFTLGVGSVKEELARLSLQMVHDDTVDAGPNPRMRGKLQVTIRICRTRVQTARHRL
jgi:hypothetical protein